MLGHEVVDGDEARGRREQQVPPEDPEGDGAQRRRRGGADAPGRSAAQAAPANTASETTPARRVAASGQAGLGVKAGSTLWPLGQAIMRA